MNGILHMIAPQQDNGNDDLFDEAWKSARRNYGTKRRCRPKHIAITLDTNECFDLDVPVDWVPPLVEMEIPPVRENEATKKNEPEEPKRAHGPDFRSVVAKGRYYALTATQAKVVAILWAAWENSTPDVGQEYLLEEAESNAQQLKHIFDSSDAWGTLIVPGQTKGTYRLDL